MFEPDRPPIHPPAPPTRWTPLRVPKWRSAIVLLLALAMTGTTGPALGQVPGPGDPAVRKYVFLLHRSWPGVLDHLCVDDPMIISVTAEQHVEHIAGTDLDEGESTPPVLHYGVFIEASVSDSSIGTIAPPILKTSGRDEPPGSVDFVFTPREVGSTQIAFTGTKGDLRFRSDPLDVTVVECDFILTTNSIWRVPGPANIAFVAIVHEARLRVDEGGSVSVSVPVTWTGGAAPVRDCSGTVVLGASKANVSGTVNDEGRLTFDVVFDPATVTTEVTCKGVKGTTKTKVTAEKLHLQVLANGGSATLGQDLVGPQRVSGASHMLVTRDDQ